MQFFLNPFVTSRKAILLPVVIKINWKSLLTQAKDVFVGKYKNYFIIVSKNLILLVISQGNSNANF